MKLEDYLNSKNNKSSYRTSLIRRTLLTGIIILSALIICNFSQSAKDFINKYVLKSNLNFAKINSLYKKYFLDIKTQNEDKSELVNENKLIEYENVEDYNGGALLTVGDMYPVKMLESGLVVFVGQKEPYGSSVVVQQSNGIDVIYGNVTGIDIKIYDYIEKGTIIGTADKELYLLFQKDGETLDYNTYI